MGYWVFDADPEAFSQWMVVGYPSENWLWFLSRSTSLDSTIIEETIDKLVEAGHYTRSNLESQLIQTDQSYGTKDSLRAHASVHESRRFHATQSNMNHRETLAPHTRVIPHTGCPVV